MHELCFSDVSCPDRHVVLRLPLRDFSIGHRLILLRQRNPLLWMSEEEYNSLPTTQQIYWLIEAVYVCGQSYAFRKRLEQGAGTIDRLRNWMAVKAWHWRRRREKTDWALETANFRNYLNQGKLTTEYKHRREGFPFMPIAEALDSKGRSLGAPYDALLVSFLMREMRFTEAQAMEYPLALAEIYYLTSAERDGGVRVLNWFETQFEEKCQAMEKEMEARAKDEKVTA